MSGLTVLHVTPHLGGGVGRVLSNYLAAAGGEQRHRVISLDYANAEVGRRLAELNIDLRDRLGLDHQALGRALEAADLTVIHWWNHPLMYAWLTSGPWPPARVLMWSHVSGRAAPQIITPSLASFPDLFAAANPITLALPALTSDPERAAQGRLIFSSAGLDHLNFPPATPHDGLRIGYLGTVDYAKMHPDFIGLCLAADLPEAVFPVAGGPEEEALRREIARRGDEERFEILGPVADPAAFLSGLDIFGYPLNPEHYGTGEQVLIEALAAGVPPVVLGGGAEEFVVQHEVTGLVAQDGEDYARCLHRLGRNARLRAELGAGARRRARERFDLSKTVEAFDRLYQELMERPKLSRRWPGVEDRPDPWQIFLTSQGDEAEYYQELERDPSLVFRRPPAPGALSATRGSAAHYAEFFPGEVRLERVSRILAEFSASRR